MTDSAPPPERDTDYDTHQPDSTAASRPRLDSAAIAPASTPSEPRPTPETTIERALATRPLWQVASGLGLGALALAIVVVELLAVSGLALQGLERALVAIVAGATVLGLFAAIPAGMAVAAVRELEAGRRRQVRLQVLRLALAIAIGGGVAGGMAVRLLLLSPW